MDSEISRLIAEAFNEPPDYRAYLIGKRLSELYPSSSVLFACQSSFDLEAFAKGARGYISAEPAVFAHYVTRWQGPSRRLKTWVETAFFNVQWKGNYIDVLYISWSAYGSNYRYHWTLRNRRKSPKHFSGPFVSSALR